jgi:hypothetical protein
MSKKRRPTYKVVDYGYYPDCIIVSNYWGTFEEITTKMQPTYGDVAKFENISALCKGLTKQTKGHCFDFKKYFRGKKNVISRKNEYICKKSLLL